MKVWLLERVNDGWELLGVFASQVLAEDAMDQLQPEYEYIVTEVQAGLLYPDGLSELPHWHYAGMNKLPAL